MIRSFLPVGQGGFAVEQFRRDEVNIVFDCGTKTAPGKSSSTKYLEKLIRQTFKPHENIEKAFVSHLHDDHINGIPSLLRYCNVKRIYLPYLTPSEQAITIMLLHETMDSENLRLLQALITGQSLNQFDLDTRVIYVLPQEQYDNDRNTSQFSETVSSGTSVELPYKNCEEWEFIPFTFGEPNKSNLFQKLLLENGITKDALREILTIPFWKKNKLFEDMYRIYSQIEKNVNLTTMVVYSGAKKDYYRQRHFSDMCFIEPYSRCLQKDFIAGCLYTGDYRAASEKEWAQLRTAYDSVWHRIGLFTIPHHGSSDYYNSEFSRQYAAFIINAGYANQYGHPGHLVLCDLIENGCRFFWVNEHIGSQAIFNIFYT